VQEELGGQQVVAVSGRIHRPGAVATYGCLCLPVGLFLYGLNLRRRGEGAIGAAVLVFACLAYTAMIAPGLFSTADPRLALVGVLGLPLAPLLYLIERAPYQRAIQAGGRPARWWPPLVILVLLIFAVAVLVMLRDSTGDDEAAQPNSALNPSHSAVTARAYCGTRRAVGRAG